MQLLHKLIRFGRKSPREQLRVVRATVRERLIEKDWKVPHTGNDRTTYVMGLFGSGRTYLVAQIVQNIGNRAEYFRDSIRFHAGPTSMIYSGHATMKHASQMQWGPRATSRILEAVRSGFADLIFIYRHPLDSLLTNWAWWRIYNRDEIMISGLSQVYKNTDELCADLDQNFAGFLAFAEGDPNFFATKVSGAWGDVLPTPRFLSFAEFVEETELYLRSATLTLRLEDFTVEPLKEFAKVVKVMSLDLDLSHVHIDSPRTKPYGYLEVKDKVPRFKNFIDGLDADSRERIEKLGYKI